jgi:Rieske 2Fe-2S family protein
VCVGRAEEVENPGDYRTYDVAGESIFVTRNAEGHRGFFNVCSHRGRSSSTTARLREEGLQVPLPRVDLRFLDGRCRHAERGAGRVLRPHELPAPPGPPDTAGFLFANLSADEPMLLRESLTTASSRSTDYDRFGMEDLRIGHRIVYEVEANWKIWSRIHNECLHCPSCTLSSCRVVPLFRFGEVWDEEVRDDGLQMAEGATSFNPTGKSTLP